MSQNRDMGHPAPGNVRVTLSDGTGAAATAPGSEQSVTAAHEIYRHAVPLVTGQPWQHDNGGPVDQKIKTIDDHTKQLNQTAVVRAFMTKNSFTGCIVPLLLMLLFGGAVASGQEVNFCLFSLPQGILQANASFNAIYEFDVDKNGVPTNIQPRAKEFTNPSDVRACLEQWKLREFALKHLIAIFEWHHGVGWTKLAISGPGVDLTIHQSGQRCPYGSMAQESAKTRGTP